MRVLLFVFIFVLISAGSGFSQTVPTRDAFQKAALLAKEGRYAEALEKYLSVPVSSIAEESKDTAARVHFNIGVCFYHLDQPEKAVARYRKALELTGGTYQKAFYTLGMAQAALGNTAEAKAAFYQAVKLDKNDGEAWFDLAMVLLAQKDEKDYDAATRAFENAVKNGSINSADAINNLGVIAALQGDLAAAEKKFREALAMAASPEAANNLKICALLTQGSNRELVAGLIFSR